ncbi:acyltransferase [Clostridium lacusfryxellense]|uniref:acyltransferase n=1 Tax=Clostridium lacusfryxellense TaxID=205328 RepID=UPI001C0AE2E9|nr:acyltransferase [Clostridium lacusfryxellense]MBU3111060.1 acyltransferase [Clostridium lacusfryxellense]
MENKDLFFQKVRGISIIAVVLIHALGMTYKGDTNIILILRQFINFPVAIFFFISGYFIKQSKFINVKNIKNFITSRLIRITIPYLVWSILSIIFISNSYNFNLKKICISLLMGQVVAPYYFIIVMIQLILITPIVTKVMRNNAVSKLLWFITPVFLVQFYIIQIIFKINIMSSMYYALPFVMWFSFYYYGIVIGNKPEKEAKISSNIKINIKLYVVFLVASIIEAQILNSKFELFGFAQSQLKISSLVCTFFLINVFIGSKSRIRHAKANDILVKIGDNSFGIFLIHIFILMIVSKIGAYILKTHSYPFYITIMFALITLIVSYLGIVVVKKIIPKKYSRKILGF